MRGWLAALLLLMPALAGCLGGGGASGLVVVAQAPKLANGMSIALAVPRTLFGPGEGTATYFISRDGQAVWPPNGELNAPSIQLREGKGSAFVPYAWFVVGNGDYTVTVDLNGQRSTALVPVEKWVNWVYALPYIRGQSLVADLVLARSSGTPNDRIFAEGQLNLEVRYKGPEGRQDSLRMARTMFTSLEQDFTRLEIPLTSFKSDDRGYYSVEAVFHNFQANGNNWVGMDPSLGYQRPPTNWVHIPPR